MRDANAMHIFQRLGGFVTSDAGYYNCKRKDDWVWGVFIVWKTKIQNTSIPNQNCLSNCNCWKCYDTLNSSTKIFCSIQKKNVNAISRLDDTFLVDCGIMTVMGLKSVLTRHKIWAVKVSKILNNQPGTKRNKQTWRAKIFAIYLSFHCWSLRLLSQSCILVSCFDACTKHALFSQKQNMGCARMFPARTDQMKANCGLKQTSQWQILLSRFL